jgi:bifunctional ADP-heptose synthase (sugar kinase/adenylyltransferase)
MDGSGEPSYFRLGVLPYRSEEAMLTDTRVEEILARIPALTVGVIGDLFLDRYLDIDATLTEPSIETGLDAYQVTRVRSYPGAAGTVINNLVALGVKRVCAVSVIGDDGEGYELRQALAALRVVDCAKIISTPGRRTPTYTKPILHEPGQPARELNRLDIKNRAHVPGPLQDWIMEGLEEIWPQVDALLVLDQVSEDECGVITARVRDLLVELGGTNPHKFILADSRVRLALFRSVSVKPNAREWKDALEVLEMTTVVSGGGLSPIPITRDEELAMLADHFGRPVFATVGEVGMYLASREAGKRRVSLIPAYPVRGPIDPVGAGDSTSAAIACAVAAGASLEEAAAFGNLVASITIQQIGITGTAAPEQVRQRWREVRG